MTFRKVESWCENNTSADVKTNAVTLIKVPRPNEVYKPNAKKTPSDFKMSMCADEN